MEGRRVGVDARVKLAVADIVRTSVDAGIEQRKGAFRARLGAAVSRGLGFEAVLSRRRPRRPEASVVTGRVPVAHRCPEVIGLVEQRLLLLLLLTGNR